MEPQSVTRPSSMCLLCLLVFLIVCWGGQFASGAPRSEVSRHTSLSSFAIKELDHIIAWRDLTLAKRVSRLIRDYAPKHPLVHDALETLKKVHFNTFYPFLGRSKGIDTRRGLLWLYDAQGRVRILISSLPQSERQAFLEVSAILSPLYTLVWSTEENASRASLLEAGGASAPNVTSRSLSCAPLSGWVICDEEGVQSAAPPEWWTDSLDRGAVWVHFVAPKWLPSLLEPWSSIGLHADLEGDHFSVIGDFNMPANPIFAIISATKGQSGGMNLIHPASPASIKLSVNPSELLLYASLYDVSWVNLLSSWAEAGWSGELILTLDGAIDHPVIIAGLKPHPWSGQQLSKLLAQQLNLSWDQDLSESGRSQWTFTVGEQTWSLPIGWIGDHLVIGLFSADVDRRTQGLFSIEDMPNYSAISAKGVSGLIFDPALFHQQSTNPHINLHLLSIILGYIFRGESQEIAF